MRECYLRNEQLFTDEFLSSTLSNSVVKCEFVELQDLKLYNGSLFARVVLFPRMVTSQG